MNKKYKIYIIGIKITIIRVILGNRMGFNVFINWRVCFKNSNSSIVSW